VAKVPQPHVGSGNGRQDRAMATMALAALAIGERGMNRFRVWGGWGTHPLVGWPVNTSLGG
jgi:hypothetical protein